jgi:hypothetical protein
MNISLHIQRIILEGINLPVHQRPALQAAVTAELTRMLAEGGLTPDLTVGGALTFVRANDLQIPTGDNPTQLGNQIAQSVYSGIGNQR